MAWFDSAFVTQDVRSPRQRPMEPEDSFYVNEDKPVAIHSGYLICAALIYRMLQ